MSFFSIQNRGPQALRRAAPCLLALVVMTSGCRRFDADLVSRLEGINTLNLHELPPPSGPLTVDGAVERSIAGSTRIAELVTQVDIASKQRLAARDLRDPELRASYGEDESLTTRTSSPLANGRQETGTISGEGSQYQVGLRFFVPNPFERKAQRSAATADIYARVADLYHEQWTISLSVRELYAEIDYLEQDITLLSKLSDVYSNVLERERSRLEKGAGSLEDVTTASRRFLAILSDRDQVVRSQEAKLRELSALVSVPVARLRIAPRDPHIQIKDVLHWPTSELIQIANRHREDLVSRAWAARAAKGRLAVERSRNIPWPSHLQASYSEDESSGTRSFSTREFDASNNRTIVSQSAASDEGDGEEWRVDAALALPVFSTFGHAKDLRKAEFNQALFLASKTAQSVARDVRHAVESLEAIIQAQRRYEEQTQALLQELQDTVDKENRVRVLDDIDLARAKEDLLQAERTRLKTGLDGEMSLLQLEKALGLRLETVATKLGRPIGSR